MKILEKILIFVVVFCAFLPSFLYLLKIFIKDFFEDTWFYNINNKKKKQLNSKVKIIASHIESNSDKDLFIGDYVIKKIKK